MTLPLIRLVERRARDVRLAADEVAFLLAHARNVIEVSPTFRKGVYRLTARGFVGWLHTPHRHFAIAPKIPWPNLRMLLGLPPAHGGAELVDPDGGLLNMLAREFLHQLRDVARTGFVAGYHDRDTTGNFLRGKLRAAEQLRDAAARAFPDRFHIRESVLDLNTAWNRILRAVAEKLLSQVELSPALRGELQSAMQPLEEVPLEAISVADFAESAAEPRATHYAPLLALCRLLHDGFFAAGAERTHTGFLIDLSRAFERYLANGLSGQLARHSSWELHAQPAFPIGPTVLQPDILLRQRGESRVVLDAKWKSAKFAPAAEDLHQILAYATLTGAKHVGLVYPGCHSGRREYAVVAANIRVSLLRLQVVGTQVECLQALRTLGRFVRRSHR